MKIALATAFTALALVGCGSSDTSTSTSDATVDGYSFTCGELIDELKVRFYERTGSHLTEAELDVTRLEHPVCTGA